MCKSRRHQHEKELGSLSAIKSNDSSKVEQGRLAIPSVFPYLKSSASVPLDIDDSVLNIGLTWESNRKSDTHDERSTTLDIFTTLLEIDNTQFYSLQVDDANNQIYHLNLHNKIIDASKHLTNFNQTANLIERLDIIISVDTAVAHLAGALNKRCLTLIPYNPNWRWLLYGKNTPWYEALELFRVGKDQHYQSLIDKAIYPIIKKEAMGKEMATRHK